MADLTIDGIPVDLATFRRYRELIADPAYLDRRAIGHSLAVAEVSNFYEQLVTSAAPAGSANAGAGAPPADGAAAETARQRIAELQRHAAFADARHPEHRAVVDEMSAAYHALTGESDPAAGGADQGGAATGGGVG